jgi:putative endonuclease
MDARGQETGESLDREASQNALADPDWDRLATTKPDLLTLPQATEGASVREAARAPLPSHAAKALTLGWSRQWFWLLIDRARQVRQRRNLTADAALGRRGEDLAHRYLRARGFTIVARNFTLPDRSGEIDIVARDGDITVFVEVKSRVTDQYGAPDRAIGPDKQERITRAAEYYCYRASVEWDHVRFDVVSIVFGNTPKIAHAMDAFFLGRTR